MFTTWRYLWFMRFYYWWKSDARSLCQMLQATHFVSDVAYWGWCQIVLEISELVKGGARQLSADGSMPPAATDWILGKRTSAFTKLYFAVSCSLFFCFVCLGLFESSWVTFSLIAMHWVILSHLEFLVGALHLYVDTLIHYHRSVIFNQPYSNFGSENCSLYSCVFHCWKECNWIVLKV